MAHGMLVKIDVQLKQSTAANGWRCAAANDWRWTEPGGGGDGEPSCLGVLSDNRGHTATR